MLLCPLPWAFHETTEVQLSCYFFLAALLLYPSSLTQHYQPYILLPIHSVQFISACKQDINLLPRANTTKNMAVSVIKRLALTEAPMWFPIHLDDIVKVHQQRLQRRKRQCSVGAPPERQNRNSFKMDSLHKPVNRKNNYSCAFVNISYICQKVSLFQKEPFIRNRHNPCDIAHCGCAIEEYDGARLSMCCDFFPPPPLHTTESHYTKSQW